VGIVRLRVHSSISYDASANVLGLTVEKKQEVIRPGRPLDSCLSAVPSFQLDLSFDMASRIHYRAAICILNLIQFTSPRPYSEPRGFWFVGLLTTQM
jgi:hypothetical protein